VRHGQQARLAALGGLMLSDDLIDLAPLSKDLFRRAVETQMVLATQRIHSD
jgi:hypothetical protein